MDEATTNLSRDIIHYILLCTGGILVVWCGTFRANWTVASRVTAGKTKWQKKTEPKQS